MRAGLSAANYFESPYAEPVTVDRLGATLPVPPPVVPEVVPFFLMMPMCPRRRNERAVLPQPFLSGCSGTVTIGRPDQTSSSIAMRIAFIGATPA